MPEKFTLTPEQVANDDPFGVRKTPASLELRGLLEQERKSRVSGLPEFEARLIDTEVEAWRKVLGVDVEIPPLPAEVITEVADRLEREGFTIVCVPSLDLSPDRFKKQDPQDYLAELGQKYPNWKTFESLTDSEKDDPKVCRNLEKWFWEKIKEGSIEFPTLEGYWLAVETLPKPPYGDEYQKTDFSKRLGFEDRFNTSWDDAKKAIDKAESRFLKDLGLTRGNVRFLEVLEWNLLGNRFGWGATNTYEWTNTEARKAGKSNRLIVGHSGHGGAALVDSNRPDYSSDNVGFRVAVEIGP